MYKEILFTIDDKKKFDKIFYNLNLGLCDYTFQNCYYVKENIRYIEDEYKNIYLVENYADNEKTLIPLGIYFNKNIIIQNNINYIRIPSQWEKNYLLLNSKIKRADIINGTTDKIGAHDYIYNINEVIDMKGKKFEYIRYRYNYCIKKFNPKIINFSNEYIGDVFKLLHYSYKFDKKCSIEDVDFIEDIIGLSEYDKLMELTLICLINDDVCGYCNSFKASDDTSMLYTFKNYKKFKGIHQFMFIESCKIIRNLGYKYINFCDDWWQEGLRFIKMKYNPIKFAERTYLQYDR